MQRRKVAQLAVETLGPQRAARLRVHKLQAEPDLVAHAVQAALEHVAHAELAADLACVDMAVAVGVGRAAPDDEAVRDAREVDRDLLGHRLGEVLLLRAAVAAGQRQHDDRQRRRAAAPGAIGGEPGRGAEREHGQRQHPRPPAVRGRRRSAGQHGRGEQIASPRHGLDQLLRAVADRLPDVADAAGQRFVGHHQPRPDGSHQLVLGHHAAGVARQTRQHVEALGPQLHRALAAQQRAAREVEREVFKAQHRVGGVGHAPSRCGSAGSGILSVFQRDGHPFHDSAPARRAYWPSRLTKDLSCASCPPCRSR